VPFSLYMDLGIVSLFTATIIVYTGYSIFFGVMHPNGTGVMITNGIAIAPPYLLFGIATLHKAEDNWTPTSE